MTAASVEWPHNSSEAALASSLPDFPHQRLRPHQAARRHLRNLWPGDARSAGFSAWVACSGRVCLDVYSRIWKCLGLPFFGILVAAELAQVSHPVQLPRLRRAFSLQCQQLVARCTFRKSKVDSAKAELMNPNRKEGVARCYTRHSSASCRFAREAWGISAPG